MLTEKKTEPVDEKEFGRRLGLVVLFFSVFVVAIIAMLLNIQVFNVAKYKDKANRQYARVKTDVARRGSILDRHSRMLAESIESVTFYADPKTVRQTPLFDKNGKAVMERGSRKKQKTFDNSFSIASRFARYNGGDRESLLKQFRRKVVRFDKKTKTLKESSFAIIIARKISVKEAMPLMQNLPPGVWFEKSQQRYYLNVAAQLIGLTSINKDGFCTGISGIEVQYQNQLSGSNGCIVFQRNAIGLEYPAPDVRQVEAVDGNTVVLTIDADIQSVVEYELAAAVARFNADAASSIVMDVKTGEILAMATAPAFDLNRRISWNQDLARNRAITDSYEPGSTFKIIMAAAATEVLHRKAEDRVFAHNGDWALTPRLHVRDHEPYGEITFREALMYSSNVVAAQTAMQVGAETFNAYVRNFGFGSKTGIGLVGESSGIVRPLSKWDKTTLPWMGYGYQVMATPLQILQAYAAIANDGELMKPYLVKRIVDPEGQVVEERQPEKIRRVVSVETARYLGREYFKAVVDSGTAKKAFLPGISVAGKTGTAQRATKGSYANRVYVSSFVGYFPVESPRYAIIVSVENPRTQYYAGAVAAPVFSSVGYRMIACSSEMQKNLAMRSLELDSIAAVTTIVVPDLSGLSGKDAKQLLSWLNLSMEYSGDFDGAVIAQNIQPGNKVPSGQVITVRLGSIHSVKKAS